MTDRDPQRLAPWRAAFMSTSLALLMTLASANAFAAQVRSLELEASEPGSILRIGIDGPLRWREFTMDDPPRLVIDLQEGRLLAAGSALAVRDELVRGVRYSQFALEPAPVTRVVIDLWQHVPHRIVREGDVLRVVLGQEPIALPETETAPAPDPAPVVASVSAPVLATGSAPETLASVTYMTLSTIYVSAGSDDGLAIGDELNVVRDNATLGRVRIQEISRHRAACVLVEQTSDFSVGDHIAPGDLDAERSPGAASTALLRRSPSTVAAAPSSNGTGSQAWLRGHGFRGRIGARYLSVQDRTGLGQSFSQPALDLRIEGREIGGSPFDLSVDVRTRRTYRSMPDGESSSDGRSRVYRANGSWSPFEGRASLGAGRQYSPELPALGIFDGVSGVVRLARWSCGILSGTQPDAEDFGYSSEIREHGAFVQVRSAQGSNDAWNATLGVVASYADGEVNREYAAFQTSVSKGRFSTYFSQDVDLNREWKLEAEGRSLSFTNTYSSLRLQAARGTVVSAGYDNRRSVRLYRDFVSPESEFDDAYRQGTWVGMDQRLGRSVRLGLKVKRSTGGSTEHADSYTLNGAIQWPVALRARTTYFSNALVEGWIHSGSASAQLGPSLRLELGGGVRREQTRTSGGSDSELTWTNLTADYALGRSWYASLSYERSDDGPEATDQVYTTVSYRF